MISRLIDYNHVPEKKKCDISFNLPISFINNRHELNNIVKNDLELIANVDTKSLYSHILSSKLNPSEELLTEWSKYYTTDINYLKDTQELIKSYTSVNVTPLERRLKINNTLDILQELESETGFYEKYKYIDVDLLKPLNKIPIILQYLTIYNLAAPVLSLAIPILMLILPFLILKFQGVRISITTYTEILINLFKNHVLGKIFTQFTNADWDKKVFAIFSIAFYFFNIYQNIRTCITFYKSIYKIKNHLNTINDFNSLAIDSINNIKKYCKNSYKGFIDANDKVKDVLYSFKNEIDQINMKKFNIIHVTKIGNILKCFYDLYDNVEYKAALYYAINLQYYIANIENVQLLLKHKFINCCKFSKKTTNFSNAYFAALINDKPITNTYSLKQNILITGPNAAGKTTMLKTTLFNIILSQQLGIGCYKKANINVYTYIHSYINIPDTSQRDSLFQAEARRCKEILDSLDISLSTERHFCIFDEIYSGTNPSEAIASAASFLTYIADKNIDFMLTTHYITLCNILTSNKKLINKHMEVINNTKNTYKLKDEISLVKGGIKVLEDLGYNTRIIADAKNIINKINI